jgi:Cytosol aminopeptidase family, N-terminal domain
MIKVIQEFKKQTSHQIPVMLCLLLMLGQAPRVVGQASPADLPAVGTKSEGFQAKNGPSVNVMVQSPPDMDAPLQIMCFFEYQDGESFNGANVEADQKLHGLIQELRKSGKFTGRPLETLLIAPPTNTIQAKQLLLIGLGKPDELSLDLMKSVGRVEMREALRLGVSRYAHASDLRDGGSEKFGVGEVARSVIEGALSAYATEKELQGRGFAKPGQITNVTYLAGPKYFNETVGAVKAAVGFAGSVVAR